MKLNDEILQSIKNADSKALATLGHDGPNVVPVSMVFVDQDEILILDCFMNKSVINLKHDDRVALSFWKGLTGVQLKGKACYVQSGERFDSCVMLLKKSHPERVLRGVLFIKTETAYDLAPKTPQ